MRLLMATVVVAIRAWARGRGLAVQLKCASLLRGRRSSIGMCRGRPLLHRVRGSARTAAKCPGTTICLVKNRKSTGIEGCM